MLSGALPSGLTLSSGGLISGTPTTTGTFIGNIDAGNGTSPDATEGFDIVVDQAPSFTGVSAAPTPATYNVGYSFQYTATGTPAPSFSLDGTTLPSGLTLSSSGLISGTPTAAAVGQTFTGIVDAGNGVGTDATEGFDIVVDQVPTVTSAASTTFTVGTAGTTFTITSTGFPTPSFTETLNLATEGLTFTDNGNGTATLSGTPLANTGNTYALAVTASNGVGANFTQNFTLTIDQAPSLSAPSAATSPATQGAAYSFQYQAPGFPTPTFSLDGTTLPSGLTLELWAA